MLFRTASVSLAHACERARRSQLEDVARRAKFLPRRIGVLAGCGNWSGALPARRRLRLKNSQPLRRHRSRRAQRTAMAPSGCMIRKAVVPAARASTTSGKMRGTLSVSDKLVRQSRRDAAGAGLSRETDDAGYCRFAKTARDSGNAAPPTRPRRSRRWIGSPRSWSLPASSLPPLASRTPPRPGASLSMVPAARSSARPFGGSPRTGRRLHDLAGQGYGRGRGLGDAAAQSHAGSGRRSGSAYSARRRVRAEFLTPE